MLVGTNPEQLLLYIERLRERLYQVYNETESMTHSKVLATSKELDQLLQQYENIQRSLISYKDR